MSSNDNAAAAAVSPAPVTLAISVFRASGATIGPRLPPSVVYWSERLSVFLVSYFYFPAVFKGPVAGLLLGEGTSPLMGEDRVKSRGIVLNGAPTLAGIWVGYRQSWHPQL